jgi:CIC family chloride channel protein
MRTPPRGRVAVAARAHADGSPDIGDFTTTKKVLPIAVLAIVIGVIGAVATLVLLRLIDLFTNLFYFHRWSVAPASPADHHLGLLGGLAPVAGALIIGLMARYGSDRIRGHGIPEALESILIGGSRAWPC